MGYPKKFCSECGQEMPPDIVLQLRKFAAAWAESGDLPDTRALLLRAANEIERLRANQCKCP
jgi:hypothetical protein